MKQSLLRILNTLSLLGVLVVNWLADALPINGLTTGQISAMYPVQITPAPYAFSIWGLIYALLIGFVIVQWMPKLRERAEVKSIGPWFAVSCLFNVSWILVWHYLYITTSVFVMLGLVVSLIAVYLCTRPFGWSSEPLVLWLLQVPFSIYLGWISVAAIVNAAAALYAAQWDGFGMSGTVWTVFLILLASILTLAVGWFYTDPAYVLVPVWAFIAIGVANQGNSAIVYMGGIAAILLFVFALCLLASRKLQWNRSAVAG
ncbi:hypothetical protein [Paenibacillus radicis (ex Xue et al. 2023)]|uniref:Tryptophan-rich sensory protein n=1 Tax=Paenibacillus radicis (ex Xue et al. 2023) TaxID=2972489 RepID=A0ABT1YDT9_9BACL|nr:hypothetical protein [Paenibacillus radicis (ex Xue et al. 2023)]MCR8631357.1 hypothetical protein [Paenibacillus radicis (ex Xue et al. 2023)]